jgi:hypothetical protein
MPESTTPPPHDESTWLDTPPAGFLAELVERVGGEQYERWAEQVRRTGGCANPIHLIGSAVGVDPSTGEIVERYDTDGEPNGRLLVPCGDRRAIVCPSCSAVYRLDTFHLLRAGLAGGKGVPESVRDRPRVFLTLTAPSFGAVHARRMRGGHLLVCRPGRRGELLAAGHTHACDQRHAEDDPALGTPVCVECYDYVGAVLWQAHAGRLWRRFTIQLRRDLARELRVPRGDLAELLRLSYAKVAEFQRRGLVHYHAAMRVDGPDGPASRPPAEVDAAMVERVIRSAAGSARLVTPVSRVGEWELRFGPQLDVAPISQGSGELKIAGYIAKYATKAAEATGATPGRVTSLEQIRALPLSEHIRTLTLTAWRLGGLREFEHLRLRRWAHMLAYSGHFSSKSRVYSTTLGALRAARAEHERDENIVYIGHWRYAGRGHSAGDAALAAGIAEQLRQNRRLGRDVA